LPKTASERNYVRIAVDYAAKAADKKNSGSFGKWVRMAALRFQKDLKRSERKNHPFLFDEWHANDACDFIEKLPHVEGQWETPTITLHESDVFFIVNLFGFRKPDGSRRFSMALKAIARKNAKSTIAAAIGLYCLCCEDEVGPQVITGATTGSQARIVFNVAKRMVEKTAALREAFTLEPFANAIASYGNGGTFKPINAKASTQDGLNPSTVILDEIHAHKTHDLLNVLQSAAGARKNPLFLYATTEGYESPGPWPELRHFTKQVLEGIVEADHFLCLYYAVDDTDDDFDESTWIKANPLMDVNPILMTEIKKAAIEAKGMPGRHAEFKIKRLNRPSASAESWINLDKWRACVKPVDLDWLESYPCYGGLDLADTGDLCSWRLVWLVNGVYYTWGRRWVCTDAVSKRTERGTVPYAGWVSAGHIEQTPGSVIDHDVVEARILEDKARFNIVKVNHDNWKAKRLTPKLIAAGLPMEPFIQGPKSYDPAMQEFDRAYKAGNFVPGVDPVLNWCASNLVARKDVNGNIAPDKKKSPDKIDDMVAMLMAFGGWVEEQPEEKSFWESA